MAERATREGDERDPAKAPDPDHDTIADTGVEGGVDAPNEDLDVGVDEPKDE